MGLFKKKMEPMIEREDGLLDYNIYVMGKNEKWLNIALAAGVLFGIGFVFYKSIIFSALLMVFAVKFPEIRVKQIIFKRKKSLNIQFKDMLYSLASSLSAGKSIESGFRETLSDLVIIYPDPETNIINEVQLIIRGIEMNETIEDMLQQFADRAHIEDIENFADIFRTCKRTGGDIIQVIRSTSNVIGEKIEIKEEIETLIAGKKFEFKVLMIMPIFLILLLTYTAADYMEPVFTTIAGRFVMTIAIGLFVVAYFVGEKIMNIEV